MNLNFWNGNKSPARQRYELEILKTILEATRSEYGPSAIEEDLTDYPRAEDEGNVFSKGTDLLVTVAGNAKFSRKAKIEINLPVAKGLLGNRLLIIREDRLPEFAAINSVHLLKDKSIGIPATWADADLFRANDFVVVEKGRFEEVFTRLKGDEFDYVALGANEVEEAFEQMAKPLGGLTIEPSLLVYYPFPLVFFVNPSRPELARRITSGLREITRNGRLDTVFDSHYGGIFERLALKRRKVFRLFNPFLPESLR